jgi:hypothetical protein
MVCLVYGYYLPATVLYYGSKNAIASMQKKCIFAAAKW